MKTTEAGKAIRMILAHLENGDPVEAKSQLEILLLPSNEHPPEVRKLLEKAENETDSGDPDIAVIHLQSVLDIISEPYQVATSIPWRPDHDADDNGVTNEARALRAKKTLEWYKVGQLGEGGQVCDETLADLLADIRHYCQREGIDFAEALGSANTNYLAER